MAPFMDRDKVTKATAQTGFISFVLIPMFETVTKVSDPAVITTRVRTHAQAHAHSHGHTRVHWPPAPPPGQRPSSKATPSLATLPHGVSGRPPGAPLPRAPAKSLSAFQLRLQKPL